MPQPAVSLDVSGLLNRNDPERMLRLQLLQQQLNAANAKNAERAQEMQGLVLASQAATPNVARQLPGIPGNVTLEPMPEGPGSGIGAPIMEAPPSEPFFFPTPPLQYSSGPTMGEAAQRLQLMSGTPEEKALAASDLLKWRLPDTPQPPAELERMRNRELLVRSGYDPVDADLLASKSPGAPKTREETIETRGNALTMRELAMKQIIDPETNKPAEPNTQSGALAIADRFRANGGSAKRVTEWSNKATDFKVRQELRDQAQAKVQAPQMVEGLRGILGRGQTPARQEQIKEIIAALQGKNPLEGMKQARALLGEMAKEEQPPKKGVETEEQRFIKDYLEQHGLEDTAGNRNRARAEWEKMKHPTKAPGTGKLVGMLTHQMVNAKGEHPPSNMEEREAAERGFHQMTAREEAIIQGAVPAMQMVNNLFETAKALRDNGGFRTAGGIKGLYQRGVIDVTRLAGAPEGVGGTLNLFESQKGQLLAVMRALNERGNIGQKILLPQIEGMSPAKGFIPVVRMLKILEGELKSGIRTSRMPGYVDKLPSVPDLLAPTDPRYKQLRARGLTDQQIEAQSAASGLPIIIVK